MIDLHKVDLLEALLQLPYTFVMPDILFNDEWLCLSDEEKAALCGQGLEVRELPGKSVERATRYFNQHVPLTLNDCFALALAEEMEDCILMSGDGSLRRIADSNSIQVRGVLWVTDELETHNIVEPEILRDALRVFRDDDAIFLPEDQVLRRFRRLSQRLKRG